MKPFLTFFQQAVAWLRCSVPEAKPAHFKYSFPSFTQAHREENLLES